MARVLRSTVARRLQKDEARALDVLAQAVAAARGLRETPLPARVSVEQEELGDALEQRGHAERGDGPPALALGASGVEGRSVADDVARERDLLGHAGERGQVVLLQPQLEVGEVSGPAQRQRGG